MHKVNTREFRKIYELMSHGKYLFCKCTVGLRVRKPLWKEGFAYQLIRDGKEELQFVYTLLKFSPFIWTKKKLDRYLEKLFSWVPDEAVIEDHSGLGRFNEGPQVYHLSYPENRELEEGEEGVFYILPDGEKVCFLKGKGKPLPKWETLTLFHPLCPAPFLL